MKKILLLRGNDLLDQWRQQHFSETRNRKAECEKPVTKKREQEQTNIKVK